MQRQRRRGPRACAAPAGLTPSDETCAASFSGGDTCAACVRASCCEATLACFSETACTCLIGGGPPGLSWPNAGSCGEEDAAYAAKVACLSQHCATRCPLQ